MKLIHRRLHQVLENNMFKGKVIILVGARQVGKSTLFDSVVSGSSNVLRLNCDNYDDRSDLENKTSTELRQLMGNHEVVIIDEAQRAKNIGLSLKMLADLKLPMQILVTGSSSLTLANEINEPATGRLIEYNLFPLSLVELMQQTSHVRKNGCWNNV